MEEIHKTEQKIADLQQYLKGLHAALKQEEDNEMIKSIRGMKLDSHALHDLLNGIQEGTVKFQVSQESEEEGTGSFVFTEKKEAGAALLAVCKDMKAVDAAMDIGNYQGFNMRIQFDSWSKEFILSVKHESVSKVHLGADALGNITRINNLLEREKWSLETGIDAAFQNNYSDPATQARRLIPNYDKYSAGIY